MAGRSWSATWFDGEFRNAIDFDPGPPPMLVNRNRVDTSGFELAGSLGMGDQWRLDASVTQARSRIAATRCRTAQPARVARRRGAHWTPFAALKFSATATYVGSSLDSSIATGDVRLDAYTLRRPERLVAGLAALETYLAIENLTDQQYEQFVGFEVRGIMPRLGVKFSL